MNNPKAKKVGDRWERTFKGTTYLMEKQPNGVNKAIERISPYKNKNKANAKSQVAQTAGKPVSKKMPIQGGNNWIAETLNKNKGIKIKQPTVPMKLVRVNRTTQVEVPVTMPEEMAIDNFYNKYPNLRPRV